MRIPEHHSDKYYLSFWSQKGARVNKVHEDQFKNDLKDSIKKRKSEEKKEQKNHLRELILKT